MLAADIQLTGVLIYALHTSRSGLVRWFIITVSRIFTPDHFYRTNSMINMLILYIVSTGKIVHWHLKYEWPHAEYVLCIGLLIW